MRGTVVRARLGSQHKGGLLDNKCEKFLMVWERSVFETSFLFLVKTPNSC